MILEEGEVNNACTLLTAIGACTTAVVTYWSWRCQKLALELQKKSFAIQEKLHKGTILFSLERKGPYVAVVLQNTGDYEVKDLSVKTTPSLAVPEHGNRLGSSVSRTWLVPNTTIARILPHQILRDDEAFLATEFDSHFQNDFSIEVTLTYTQEGLRQTTNQILDTSMLARIEHENAMRSSSRNLKDES